MGSCPLTGTLFVSRSSGQAPACFPAPETRKKEGLFVPRTSPPGPAPTSARSHQQVMQAAGNHLGGAAQVLQFQALIGALGVRFEHGARAGAIDHARNA